MKKLEAEETALKFRQTPGSARYPRRGPCLPPGPPSGALVNSPCGRGPAQSPVRRLPTGLWVAWQVGREGPAGRCHVPTAELLSPRV